MLTKQEKQKEEKNFIKTEKHKNVGFYTIVILLLLIILLSSAVGIFAWAKYQTAVNGTATAQVAKWNFNVNLKAGDKTVTLGSETINLATTKYNHVAEEKIAPGTSGEFQVIIDTTGTEVSLVYDVNISLANCPRNITFSRKAAGETTATEISAGGADNGLTRTLDFSEYVAVNPTNDNGVYTETIYWNWPYELDSGTDAEKTAYDDRDKADNGMTTEMVITVTGTEVLQGPTYLADVVSIGEYVNYNAGNNGNYSYITDSSLTGNTTSSTFSSSDSMKWKVLRVDKATKKVELMADDPTPSYLVLTGKTGYKNLETIINDIGAVYGHGKGAIGGRCLTVEDVNKLENYTPTDNSTSYTYPAGTFINDDGIEVIATKENPITMSYTANTEVKSTNADYNYTTSNFSGKSFFLASRCIRLRSYECLYMIRTISGGKCSTGKMFSSYDGDTNGTRPVLPVVTLKNRIQTSGRDASGAWNIVY